VNQSSVIFFFIFAAYFVFVTIRGELPIYMGLLLKSPSTAPSTPGVGSALSSAITVSDLAPLALGL